MTSSYKEYRMRERRRKAKKITSRIGILLLLTAAILLVAFLVVKIVESVSPNKISDPIFTPTENIYTNPELTQNNTQQNTNQGQIAGPVMQNNSEIKITAPGVATIALPENGRVDTSYFANAVFVGDSLIEGLPLYTSELFPDTTQFLYKRGITPLAFMTGQWDLTAGNFTNPVDDVVNANPGKIYIMMGTNSLASGQTDDVIIKYYGQMIDTFKEKCPNAVIYVHSVLPTCAAKAAENADWYGTARINALNEKLAAMAAEKNVCYLDLYSVIVDDAGNMQEALAQQDGFHMNKSGYQTWVNYIVCHTLHRADNPYIMGSPYYVAP